MKSRCLNVAIAIRGKLCRLLYCCGIIHIRQTPILTQAWPETFVAVVLISASVKQYTWRLSCRERGLRANEISIKTASSEKSICRYRLIALRNCNNGFYHECRR